jgi:hypothetical protein
MLAQIPNPILKTLDVPTLQEWWRADNKGYGVNGMTWLDNFYSGKGALVISTPQGVQTWQLRYPWDTVNVFTWSGGDANIKAGDFNGDGITDYVDGKGNIYQGVKNGEPPNKAFFKPNEVFSTWTVYDLNKDGKSDLIRSSANNDNSFTNLRPELQVMFGEDTIQRMQLTTYTLKQLDTNNLPVEMYISATNTLRIVCRHYTWHKGSPSIVLDYDGFRLAEIQWDKSSKLPVDTTLSQFWNSIVNSIGNYRNSCILDLSTKTYLITSVLAEGGDNNNNLVIYNLSNDKIEQVSETRMDGIGRITTLKHSIDGDSVKDWVVMRGYSGGNERIFYSGNISTSLHPVGMFMQARYRQLGSDMISVHDFSNDGIPDIAIPWTNSGAFVSFVQGPGKVTVVDEHQDDFVKLLILSVTQQPISEKGVLNIKLFTPLAGVYSFELYDTLGRKSELMSNQVLSHGVHDIQYNMSTTYIPSGHYGLRISNDKVFAETSIIIIR